MGCGGYSGHNETGGKTPGLYVLPPPAGAAKVGEVVDNGKGEDWWGDEYYKTGAGAGKYQGQYSGSSYQSTCSAKPKCPGHDGMTVVHVYPNNATLSGASRYELQRHGVDLLIDCGVDVSNSGFVKSAPPGFEDLRLHGVVPRVLRLDWTDRGAPSVGWEFWRALREKFEAGWNIVACCFGGHGRTGTCLAALLIEDGMTALDAIEHVRTVHCSDAVESKSQELYLEWLGEVMPPREEGKGKVKSA